MQGLLFEVVVVSPPVDTLTEPRFARVKQLKVFQPNGLVSEAAWHMDALRKIREEEKNFLTAKHKKEKSITINTNPLLDEGERTPPFLSPVQIVKIGKTMRPEIP